MKRTTNVKVSGGILAGWKEAMQEFHKEWGGGSKVKKKTTKAVKQRGRK
jgi:hypothetical protein